MATEAPIYTATARMATSSASLRRRTRQYARLCVERCRRPRPSVAKGAQYARKAFRPLRYGRRGGGVLCEGRRGVEGVGAEGAELRRLIEQEAEAEEEEAPPPAAVAMEAQEEAPPPLLRCRWRQTSRF